MKYYMAPMEGITGYVFRNVHHSCFPSMDKDFTPFLAPNQNGKLSPKEHEDVSPDHNQGMYVVPQILTNSSRDFIRTARTLQNMGYEEVNLNLGCPSGTVVSKRRGSGFLAFPEELNRFLYEIFSGLDMKISVKTRIGKEDPNEFMNLLEIYNQFDMEELIIHPRVQKDLYRNRPRMQMFSWAFSHSRNPVCYNGDLFRREDIENIRQEFPSLPAVMLGRGITACPGLLGDLKEREILLTPPSSGIEEDPNRLRMQKRCLREFHDRLYEAYQKTYLAASGPKVVLIKMKEIWCYLWTAFEAGEKPGKKIRKSRTLSEYETAVSAIFQNCDLIPGGGYYGTP